MKILFAAPLLLMAMPLASWSAETVPLQGDKEKINYSVGYQIGGDFKNQGVELDPEALVRGIKDAMGNAPPLLKQEEMRTVLIDLKKKIVADLQGQKKQSVERHAGEEAAFFAENAKEQGVTTLPSGLQFKSLKSGSGKSPSPKDTVTVRYRSTRLDGVEFDSTYRDNKARSFPMDSLIPGLKEALLLMKEGDTWRIFIPSALAFGEKGPLAERAVIYELELVSVQPK